MAEVVARSGRVIPSSTSRIETVQSVRVVRIVRRVKYGSGVGVLVAVSRTYAKTSGVCSVASQSLVRAADTEERELTNVDGE